MIDHMVAPLTWFGGKCRVAAEVWARFGDVPNEVIWFSPHCLDSQKQQGLGL